MYLKGDNNLPFHGAYYVLHNRIYLHGGFSSFLVGSHISKTALLSNECKWLQVKKIFLVLRNSRHQDMSIPLFMPAPNITLNFTPNFVMLYLVYTEN